MTLFDEDLMPEKRRTPEELTESERDREIAAIFAKGILRLHRSPVTDSLSEELSKSPSQGLELSREMRLSVPKG